MKRILSLVMIMFVVCASLMMGCKDKEGQAKVFIKDGIIELYTSKELDLSVILEDNYTISCEQTDVLLIEDNTVFGKKLGKATITVETEEQKYYQEIQVLDGGVRPEIRAEDFGLIVGASYVFDPVTTYKLKEIDGVTYSYSVSDTSVAEVVNGKVTAKAIGQTEIKITAQYKGVSAYAEKKVKCSVNSLDGIDVLGSYELYVRDNVDGNTFDTTNDLYANVYVDGEKVDGANVTWTIADDSIATLVDGTNGKVLTAKKVGKTTIIAEYNDGNGKVIKTKELVVEVKIPVVEVLNAQLLDLEKQTQTFDSSKIFVDASQTISYMLVGGNEYQLTENALETSSFKAGEYDCVFYNTDKTYGYKMQLVVADYVVYEPSQLIFMANHPDDYIALANDINYGEYLDTRSHIQERYHKEEFRGRFVSPQKPIYDATNPIKAEPTQVFNGTLNGMGHAIKNIELYSTGIFPTIGNATIKNLAMIGVELSDYNAACFAYMVTGKTIIDNVYVEVTSTGVQFQAGMFEQVYKNAQVTIKNSIVKHQLSKDTLENESARQNIGVISSRHSGAVTVENSYFFSEYNQLAGTIVKASENINHKLLNKLNCIFKNEDEFLIELNKEDNIVDYSNFNEYWNFEGIIPQFKCVD